jgi:tetratricopeptide (TPR) repeat protein
MILVIPQIGHLYSYEKAVLYLLLTGQQAMRLSIHEDSILQLRQGLALLAQLPRSSRRNQLELDLLLALGTSLISSQGFAVPEVGDVYTRALDLCNRVGNETQRASILFNLWVFYARDADYLTASTLAQQLMALAEQSQNEAILLQAHHALWTQSLYAGDFATAHTHAECGIALYKMADHHPLTFHYGGHDPGVCSRIFGAYAFWYLGYPDQSLQRIRAAVALARETAHAFSLAMALTLAAEIHLLRRENETALDILQEAHFLATKHTFSSWSELGAILRGWALVQQGKAELGIEEMFSGLHANREMAGKETGLHCFAQMAEAYGAMGNPADGLALLDAALASEDKSKLRHWDQWQSEMYRLQGELRLMLSANTNGPDHRVEQAEGSFRRAVDIARQQGAKQPELRATTSLCQLLLNQGRRKEAHHSLQSIYGWFTEGFDTNDLREAKMLLEEIAHGSIME